MEILFIGHDCFHQNTTYFGNDISGDCDNQEKSWTRDGALKCQTLCQEIAECVEFTWVKSGSEGHWPNGKNRCCLKKQKNVNPTAATGKVSGPKMRNDGKKGSGFNVMNHI